MTFSVIVPTYNRLSLLRRTLESLFRQEFSDYEIIVVDDGSTDGTLEYLKGLSEKKKIQYVLQKNSGPAIARNKGIALSSGSLVAFTDDDCIVPADWLKRYHEKFQQEDVGVVGGSSKTGNLENPFAEVNDIIVNFLKAEINKRPDNEVPFLTTNNTAYRKKNLEKVGGFDNRFRFGAEERDLNYRLRQSGDKLVFDSSIIIEHFNNADFSKFLRQQFSQGKGSFLFYRNAQQMFGKKPQMIPIGVYVRLLLYPFSVKTFLRALLLSVLIILAQVAVTAGYFTAAFSGKKEITPPIPKASQT